MLTIHQPEHLSWLGFFDKVRRADGLVLLDNVQYRKHYFQNRNRIRGPNGPVWLTVPVKNAGRFGQRIEAVEIDNTGNPRWRDRHLKTLQQCYARAPFLGDYAPSLQAILERDWEALGALNEALIAWLLDALGIRVEVRRASELGVTGSGSGLILEICRRVGASSYLSGVSGRDYLDLAAFAAAGIEVQFQEFHHPIYRQLHDPFVPCLSVVDLLMNHGPSSLAMIGGVGVETLQTVFK